MYSLGIENGLVYINGRFEKTNIYIDDEKIAVVTDNQLSSVQCIDATDKHILPGFIDPHVHFALGVGASISKDDFEAGSIEAALGGVTSYIDFLDPIKQAGQTQEEFIKRSKLAENSYVDYAFHNTIANPTDEPGLIFKESLSYGINSIKLFTTYADTDRRTFDEYIYELLKASREYGGWVVVHAENDQLINKSKEILVKDHEKARPAACEIQEVLKLAQMAKETGGNLYIVHTNCGSTLEKLRDSYSQELGTGQITLESCPHYFLLNSDKLAEADGYKYTMTPPIREEAERVLMVNNIDLISTIGTDHCPYTREQKNHKYTSQIPMGIGGIRYSFLNMYNQFDFSIIDKFTKNPANTYGLKDKGSIEAGKDADIVIFNTNAFTEVTDDMSVYHGKRLRGQIEMTISRGQLVNDHGRIISHRGRYIGRDSI